jgi:hypothetical protein
LDMSRVVWELVISWLFTIISEIAYAGLLSIIARRPIDLLRPSINLSYHCVGSPVDLGVVGSCWKLCTVRIGVRRIV